MNDTEKNSVTDQKLFHSRMKMLLILIKHSSLDIANATWELTKVMDDVNKETFLKTHQVSEHVLVTTILGLTN